MRKIVYHTEHFTVLQNKHASGIEPSYTIIYEPNNLTIETLFHLGDSIFLVSKFEDTYEYVEKHQLHKKHNLSFNITVLNRVDDELFEFYRSEYMDSHLQELIKDSPDVKEPRD